MARKFLTPIDLGKLELLNARIQNLGSAPGTPVAGQLYYDTGGNRLYVYNGSAWVLKATDSDLLQGQNSAYHLSRANHSGTQAASTISDFDTQVRTNRLDQMTAPTAAVSLNTQKITNLAAPTGANDAARLVDVQNVSAGLNFKDSVRAATTAAGTLASSFENGDVIDGVTLATGDRILIKNQAAGEENGIYTVAASGAPTRATDADTADEIRAAFTLVEEGTTNGGSAWVLQTDPPITLGTTALVFVQFGAGTTITAGAGLTLTGSTLDVGAGTGISVAADAVAVDTAVVVRKYATDVGDGAAVSYTITHNLGTRDVECKLRDNTTPYAYMEPDFEATTTNTVTVRFAVAPTTNQYRVIVFG